MLTNSVGKRSWLYTLTAQMVSGFANNPCSSIFSMPSGDQTTDPLAETVRLVSGDDTDTDRMRNCNSSSASVSFGVWKFFSRSLSFLRVTPSKGCIASPQDRKFLSILTIMERVAMTPAITHQTARTKQG